MPELPFAGGAVWLLHNPEEVAVVDLGGGSVGLLLFTKEDLAATYARDANQAGKTAKAVAGLPLLLGLLRNVKALGVTHLVIDHTPGRTAFTVAIDNAINYVSE
jgi:hypothetical protein